MNDRLTQVIIGKKNVTEKNFCLEYGWGVGFFHFVSGGIVAMCDSNRRERSWRCVSIT